MPASCTVVVAARDRGTRAAIRAACPPGRVRVIAEAHGRWEAGEHVRALAPDAVLVDVGLLATREFFLSGWGPISRAIRIVAIGPEDRHLAQMLRAHGAAAYVPLGRLAAELPGALGLSDPAGTAGSRR